MKLAIGTVQFGLDYGISNQSGKTSADEVKTILNIAKQNKIDTLDSAQAYGNSEEVLGLYADDYFKIITKVQAPQDFINSLNNLRRKSVYGLMFHNADVLLKNKEYWRVFESYKQENKVEKIGVSVYNEEQIKFITDNFKIDIIQLPVNVLDQRLIKSGCLKKLKEKNIEIHLRSAFLQGLLLMDYIPEYFNPIKNTLGDYFDILGKNNMTKLEGALNFVKNIKEIDKIVVGLNTVNHLHEIMDAFNKDFDVDYSQFAINDEKFINPSRWEVLSK